VVNCVQSQYAVVSCAPPGVIGDWNISGENAAFVSHARQDIPALCDEVETLKNKLAIAERALAEIAKLNEELAQRLEGEEKPDHKSDCELKAQIDRLEAEAIVLKNRVEYINKIFEINRQRQCKVVTKSTTIPKS